MPLSAIGPTSLESLGTEEVPMSIVSISDAEKAERERRVAEAIHSGEMEGLSVSIEARSDSADYIAGRIDSDELVARARARYGLD
jgi:hypothetical protein